MPRTKDLNAKLRDVKQDFEIEEDRLDREYAHKKGTNRRQYLRNYGNAKGYPGASADSHAVKEHGGLEGVITDAFLDGLKAGRNRQ